MLPGLAFCCTGPAFCRFGGKLEKLEFAPRACILLHRACILPLRGQTWLATVGSQTVGPQTVDPRRVSAAYSYKLCLPGHTTAYKFNEFLPSFGDGDNGIIPVTGLPLRQPASQNIRFRKTSPLPFLRKLFIYGTPILNLMGGSPILNLKRQTTISFKDPE